MLRDILPAHVPAAAMKAGNRREKGIALILVIWVTMLLLVITGSFLYSMRIGAKAARNAASIARAEELARAAVSRTLIELFKPPGGPTLWKRDGRERQWVFEGVPVRVRLSDESGKIDINRANNELLKGLFRSAGMSEDDAASLLDAVLDWRDADSVRHPNGAEEPEYEKAGLKARPSNQPFQTTEELQLVLGMRPEVFQRIAPMITVYSRLPGVNPHLASRNALLAIPNVTEEQVDAFIAERDAARAEDRIPPMFAAAQGFASYSQVAAVTIRADVVLDEGITVSREAVALLTPQYARRPYTFLAWREVSRDMDAKASAAAPKGADVR